MRCCRNSPFRELRVRVMGGPLFLGHIVQKLPDTDGALKSSININSFDSIKKSRRSQCTGFLHLFLYPLEKMTLKLYVIAIYYNSNNDHIIYNNHSRVIARECTVCINSTSQMCCNLSAVDSIRNFHKILPACI